MTVTTIMMPVDTRIAIVARMICPIKTYVPESNSFGINSVLSVKINKNNNKTI